MSLWNDFFNSAPIEPSDSSEVIPSIPTEKLFLRFSFFDNVISAIRVASSKSIESLISECIFNNCHSDEESGVLSFRLSNGNSVIHKVCGYNCYSCSSDGRSFGLCWVEISNHLNFSSFLFCPSEQYNNLPYGSITMSQGKQIGNNVNSSHNHGSMENSLIFGYQQAGSRISYIICTDCHAEGLRSFYVGRDVLVFSCTVIRCSSAENLVHFSGSGEIVGCNIIDCEADFAIGCAETGIAKAFDIFINNGLTVDRDSVVLVRELTSIAPHLNDVLQTFMCWEGRLFEASWCHQRSRTIVVLLSTLIGTSFFSARKNI